VAGTVLKGTAFPPGSLVKARGRDWVVLPDSAPGLLVARPLNGDPELVTGLFADEVQEATFPKPATGPGEIGDNLAAGLLRTALQVGFTSSAGPFRSFGSIAVEPRQYQLVPLLLALRMPVVRLLIADDVGIGKTIEAGLIAKEMLEQGETKRLSVLCSPALAEQWRDELAEKFAIDAELVLPSTIRALQRPLRADESVFQRYPYTVISTDFIKSETRRAQFLNTCPELVIVDEAHTCVSASERGRDQQRRYDMLREVARDRDRHLILVTATPHSGSESAFRDLIGLLDPGLAHLDLDQPQDRERLARHYVQRRRRDIRSYLDEETPFPRDRQIREVPYILTGDYATFSRKVLAYARETVAETEGLLGNQAALRRRLRWWSALALLRSVASSPRAAAATLQTRSSTLAATTPEEADELGRTSVFDLRDDEDTEGTDPAPGAEDDYLPDSARGRLMALAKEAKTLEGQQADEKLAAVIKEIKGLLADGYDPIVFCRFIPTAEYVAEHLAKELGSKARVAAVTGTLPPAERQDRIAELTGEPGRHVLVATDCLSEGVNLQEDFQAVVHYDLAWNPTRQEQREGRVDRFGQRRTYVRAVTLYGEDNGIDGIVLDVLLRKHAAIARRTGVAVPVPDRNDSVIQALVEGVLLRRDDDPAQLTLDLDFTQARDELHRAWESAAERESKMLTKYAQSGVKLDEVQAEARAARGAVGTHADVAHFVRTTLSALGASVRPEKNGFTVPILGLRPAPRNALGLPVGKEAAARDLVFHADLPVPPGEHALVRTDPFVRDLARYVLDVALDPEVTGQDNPARRCGVIRTPAVRARTTLLLARYRLHLTLPGRAETRRIVAEDAQLLAYRATPHGREWVPENEIPALLDARPENVLPELVQRAAARAIDELDQVQEHLDEHGAELAVRLVESHRRVRASVGAHLRGLAVTPSGNADVLGVYVYLPTDPAGAGDAQ
jgi:superfamily II DNA or RNA helicase